MEEIEKVKDREEALEIVPTDNLVHIAAQAEKRIDAVNKIKRIALRVTGGRDWVDQGGKPYLAVSGCEKVARLFGVSWTLDEPTFEKDEDGHYAYTFKGQFSMGGASIEAIGMRSSRDGFFNIRYENGEKKELPPDRVDRADVKKSALTNCLGSGISRILGIRNLEWQDLKESGIDISKISKVDYGKEMPEEKKGLRDQIESMLKEMAGSDDYGSLLEELTAWTDKAGKKVRGRRKIEEITEKAINIVYGKVKDAYEKRFGKGKEPEGDKEEPGQFAGGDKVATEESKTYLKVLISKKMSMEEFKHGFDKRFEEIKTMAEVNEALAWLSKIPNAGGKK